MSEVALSPRAQDVVDFIEQLLVVPEGKHVGRKVKLRGWQKEVIEGIYGTPTRREIAQAELGPQAPRHHDGDDVGRVVGPVPRGAGALVGLLAAGPAGTGGSPAPSARDTRRSAPIRTADTASAPSPPRRREPTR